MLYENIVMAASFALCQHLDFSSDCALIKEVTNPNMKQLASERPRDFCWSVTPIKASSSWETKKLGVFKWRLNKHLKCGSKSRLLYLSLPFFVYFNSRGMNVSWLWFFDSIFFVWLVWFWYWKQWLLGFLSWKRASFVVQVFSSCFCETLLGFKFLVFGPGPLEIFLCVIQSIQEKELKQTSLVSETKKNVFLISVSNAVKKLYRFSGFSLSSSRLPCGTYSRLAGKCVGLPPEHFGDLHSSSPRPGSLVLLDMAV